MATDYDFTMKVGTNSPTLDATLSGGPLSTRDLGGATVTLRLRSPAGVIVLNEDAEIVDPAAMTVRYQWPAPQALAPGVYEGEWAIRWSDGLMAIFPDDTYFLVRIVAALA